MAYTNSNQIGEITEVTGVAKIIRTDGTEETVTLGTEVFQGDIVETADGGAVNIGFIDDSSFAVSNDARISIDEFVFDPETEGGVQDFSVMKGVFMYTSGLIGRENPDQVEIDTPVGSIGIRGTIIGGDINPDGESSVSVLEGAIVVRNDGGEQLLTNQYETVTLTSRDVAPSEAQQLDATGIANKFETVKDVSPSLFSSLNDQMAQEQAESNDNAPAEIEAVAEEIIAEEGVKEQKPADEVERTLEETIQKIESLAPDLQLKIHEIHEETGHDLDHILDKKLDLKEKLIGKYGDDDRLHDIQFLNNLEFTITSTGQLKEANNGNPFSTSGPIHVATATLVKNADVTFELLTDAGGLFSINPTSGEIFFEGEHFQDFEQDGGFDLKIKTTDNNTGRLSIKETRINVENINEGPSVNLALEDVYSVGDLSNTNDDQGIIGKDVEGFRIGKLSVTDPEGDTYDTTDFSLLGNIGGLPVGTVFRVINDSDEFYLELKPGISINSATGKFNDGIADIGLPLGSSFTINLSVGGTNQLIELGIGEVENVIGTTEKLLDTNNNIVIGDDADNSIRLSDDDFAFINGGDGYDTAILESATANFVHDLSGDNDRDELSSIENINFADGDDTLKITLDSLIRLVKTSNHTVDGNSEFLISTDGTGSNVNGVSVVQNDGTTETDLTSNGFNYNGQEDRGGEIFDIYTHDAHGTIAIEATISNAGGL